MLQRKVGEQVLHDEGLTRQDIHGVDRRTVAVRQRYDLAASLRRACAACGRVRLVWGLSFAFVAASVFGVRTASYGGGILAAAFAVAAYGASTAPEWVFERPDPAFEIANTQGDGMTDKEVMERLAIVRERAEYKQERIDEKVDDAQSQNDTPAVSSMGGRRG